MARDWCLDLSPCEVRVDRAILPRSVLWSVALHAAYTPFCEPKTPHVSSLLFHGDAPICHAVLTHVYPYLNNHLPSSLGVCPDRAVDGATCQKCGQTDLCDRQRELYDAQTHVPVDVHRAQKEIHRDVRVYRAKLAF